MSDGLRLLIGHELRGLARDVRTLLLTIVLPLVVVPLMVAGMSGAQKVRSEVEVSRTYNVAVVARAGVGDRAVDQLRDHLEPRGDADAPIRLQLVERPPRKRWSPALGRGEVDAVIEIDGEATRPEYTVIYRVDRDRSQAASVALEALLASARQHRRAERLAEVGASDGAGALAVTVRDIGEAKRSPLVGQILVLVLVWMMLMGGQVVAADTVAGEKERGTLETLLTTAANRTDIVRAKLFIVVLVAITITTLNLVNVGIYSALGWMPGAPPLTQGLTAVTLGGLTVLVLPLVFMLASAQLYVSSVASSYKEAQLLNLAFSLAVLMPATAAFIPTLPLRSAIIIVPVANAAIACRELFAGDLDVWGWLIVAAVNSAFAFAVTRAAATRLASEHIVASGEAERGVRSSAGFGVDVIRWVSGLWAVLLLVQLSLSGIDIRIQLVVNLVVVLLGSSLMLTWRYRLEPHVAYSLRWPTMIQWGAALVAAPAGLVVVIGISLLSNWLLPIPPEILEGFSRELMPGDVPLWQLVLLGSVLPGVCEELFFRGTLLHGLRTRMSPRRAVLVSALAFAAFHIALFRLIPTAVLGVLFALVTVWSGSIALSMVWHTLHNAMALMMASQPGEVLPWWAFALATPVLVGMLAILRAGSKVDMLD